jgi:hypothetical protein
MSVVLRFIGSLTLWSSMTDPFRVTEEDGFLILIERA